MAVGLGKYIVDGGLSLRFSPKYPERVLQTSTLDLALRDTQTTLYALGPDNSEMRLSSDDGFNIVKKSVQDFAGTGALRYLVSTFDPAGGMLFDYEMPGRGRRVVTFANILRDKVLPLAPAIDFMLKNGQTEMQRPIEIEFAGIINDKPTDQGIKGHLYWLQIRPIIDKKEIVDDSIVDIDNSQLILSSNTALGHGNIDGVATIIYVKPDSFNSADNPAIAREISEINARMVKEGKGYVLIGPGRWGSSDSALGIPVRWPDIAGARLIVESSLDNYRIEPSQGTHFFHNLTSFGVGYFTINPFSDDGFYDTAYLDSLEAVAETAHLRIIEFDTPLHIAINGRRGAGVVFKPAAPDDNNPKH